MAIIDWGDLQDYAVTTEPDTVTFASGLDVTITGNVADEDYGTLGFDDFSAYGSNFSGFSLGNGTTAGETIVFSLSSPVTVAQIGFGLTNDVEQYAIYINGVQLTTAQLNGSITTSGDAFAASGDFITGPSNTSGGETIFQFDSVALGITGGIDSITVETLHAPIAGTVGEFSGLSFGLDPTTMICFAGHTKIAAATGWTEAKDIQVGDLVNTVDNGFQKVVWCRSRHLDRNTLADYPNLRPIRIKAGALGQGLPNNDLLVSPQHRILVSSKIIQRVCGTDQVLVAAKHLTAIDGIDVAEDVDEITFVHFLCENHELVYSEGAPAETMLLGSQALKSIDDLARAELLFLFPDVVGIEQQSPMLPSRDIVTGRVGRKIAERHQKNGKPLLEAGWTTAEQPVSRSSVRAA